MKKNQCYFVKIVLLAALSSHGLYILGSQEPARDYPAYYEQMFEGAEASSSLSNYFKNKNDLEQAQQSYQDAIKYYDEIIYSQYPVPVDPSLKFKAMLGKANFLYWQPEEMRSLDLDDIAEIRALLNGVINGPFAMADKEDWADAHFVLAQLDQKGLGLPDNKPNYGAAIQHARTLVHGTMQPDTPGYAQALQIYYDIINSPEDAIDPEVRNYIRLIYAGMHLRGEGLPNNAPDLDEAERIYARILDEGPDSVFPGDRTQARVALNLINQRKKRK